MAKSIASSVFSSSSVTSYKQQFVESERKSRRRKANREAAFRCREKKRKEQIRQETFHQDALRRNRELATEVERLSHQVSSLKHLLSQHITNSNGQCPLASGGSTLLSQIPPLSQPQAPPIHYHHVDQIVAAAAKEQQQQQFTTTYSGAPSATITPMSLEGGEAGGPLCKECVCGVGTHEQQPFLAQPFLNSESIVNSSAYYAHQQYLSSAAGGGSGQYASYGLLSPAADTDPLLSKFVLAPQQQQQQQQYQPSNMFGGGDGNAPYQTAASTVTFAPPQLVIIDDIEFSSSKVY